MTARAQRDISHVLRDQHGRWAYTPQAHDDDVVVSDETSSQLPDIVREPIDYEKHADKTELKQMAGLVDRLHDQYAEVEPGATMMMHRIVKKLDGELQGLKNRLKTQNSMMSKLWKGMKRHQSGPDVSVDYLTDTLRYTAVFDSDEFVPKTMQMIGMLGERGYSLYNPRTFKYDGRAYKGYNAVFEHKDGHFIELQIHTPMTYSAKEESHKLYSIAREMRRSNPNKYPLVERMRESWVGVKLPDGFGELPGRWA